jgi:hypothetical protein
MTSPGQPHQVIPVLSTNTIPVNALDTPAGEQFRFPLRIGFPAPGEDPGVGVVLHILGGPKLSSPTEPASDRKPDQRAAEYKHDDHDQDKLSDTREETPGLQLSGEESGLGRSEDHSYRW